MWRGNCALEELFARRERLAGLLLAHANDPAVDAAHSEAFSSGADSAGARLPSWSSCALMSMQSSRLVLQVPSEAGPRSSPVAAVGVGAVHRCPDQGRDQRKRRPRGVGAAASRRSMDSGSRCSRGKRAGCGTSGDSATFGRLDWATTRQRRQRVSAGTRPPLVVRPAQHRTLCTNFELPACRAAPRTPRTRHLARPRERRRHADAPRERSTTADSTARQCRRIIEWDSPSITEAVIGACASSAAKNCAGFNFTSGDATGKV